tara:strand:- start:153 stop:269 length:117 start_codon:yes stop_codon:yes gene_type:complete
VNILRAAVKSAADLGGPASGPSGNARRCATLPPRRFLA